MNFYSSINFVKNYFINSIVGVCLSILKYFDVGVSTDHNEKYNKIRYFCERGNPYYVLIPKVRRRKVFEAFSEENTGDIYDISDLIKSYSGQYQNFNDLEVTPEDLGFDKIKIHHKDNIHTFNKNEVIKF